MTRRLEIGPDTKPLGPEWITLDAAANVRADYHAEWGAEPLPFADASFDLIYASHVIEHIPWYKTGDALEEAYRILAPDGVLEIWTVNFGVVVNAWLNGEAPDNWQPYNYNPDGDVTLWAASRIFAYQRPGPDGEKFWHKALFDERHLRNCFSAAGFTDVVRLQRSRGFDHGAVNLGMSGTKK